MAEPARADDNRRLYQQIADQIRELIVDGRFQPGARLPGERELAQQLGVSRPSLREALIALEIAGSVEVRMGAGIYVRSVPQSGPQPTGSFGESPSELMLARAALEGAVVLQACSQASEAGLAAVRQALDEMRNAVAQGRPALDPDRRFHLAIAAMTGNGVLERLVRQLYDERYSPLSRQLSAHADTQRSWISTLREHEAILAALEARDALAAQTCMRAHLYAAQQRWVDESLR